MFDLKNILDNKEDQYCFVLLNTNEISGDETILKERYNQMVSKNGGSSID